MNIYQGDQNRPRNPVDTGHILNVHKTFRRRPERLLNVLCTFNLRPVSTGKKSLGNVCVTLSSEIFRVVVLQTKKLFQFLLLTVNSYSLELASTLNSIVSLQDPH